jgi:hypothetical protein
MDFPQRLRFLLRWSIAALLVAAGYFLRYVIHQTPWSSGPGYFIRHLHDGVVFICIYLGAPMADDATLAQGMGALLVVFAALALWFTIRDSGARRWAAPLWLLLLFVAGMSVLAAAARMGLGVNQAFVASRYVTVSSIAAITVYLLLLGARERSRFSRAVFAAYLVFLSAGIAIGYYSGWKSGSEDFHKKSAYWQTIRCYAHDDSSGLSAVYPAGFMLRVWAPLLETNRLSLFHDGGPPCSLPGAKVALYILDMLGSIHNPAEQKRVILPADQPWTAFGWAMDVASARPASGVQILIGDRSFRMNYGIHRPGIARVFKFPLSEDVGFEGTIPVAVVPKGRHQLTVRVFNRQGAYEDGTPFAIEVR